MPSDACCWLSQLTAHQNLFYSVFLAILDLWTYFLHLSLSCVILIDSSTGSPVHVLMLSIQAVCGLPRLRAPGIVPCIISFSRQLPCFLMVWTWYASLLALMVSYSSLFTPALLRTHSFVFFAVHETKTTESFSVLSSQRRQDVLLHSFWEYAATGHTSAFISRIFVEIGAVTLPYFLQWCPDRLPSV